MNYGTIINNATFTPEDGGHPFTIRKGEIVEMLECTGMYQAIAIIDDGSHGRSFSGRRTGNVLASCVAPILTIRML